VGDEDDAAVKLADGGGEGSQGLPGGWGVGWGVGVVIAGWFGFGFGVRVGWAKDFGECRSG